MPSARPSQAATLTLHPDFVVGEIDPRLYGGFIEHLGRAVYGGIYEPGHPTADEDGFRGDVLSLVRELGAPLIRYPGGNFVSAYTWEDGVGPREQRPHRLDPAWFSLETNEVGINEFAAWCRKAGAEVMAAVNLGTRGMDAARNLLEYCNHPGGTYWSDLRRQHGVAEPHGIRTWCLGNEMDGPWQIGHKTAHEYGRLAAETGLLMRRLDPSIELVACGSSKPAMPTFPEWDTEVIDLCYDVVDYLSLHIYLGNPQGDMASFLASGVEMEQYIETAVALCDTVKARKRSSKTMYLSFDEWNVWYHKRAGAGQPAPGQELWSKAPPIVEDVYTVADALVVGSMLIALINRADRIRIGCIAQLVNALGPILTRTGGGAWRQTIFFPLLQAATHGRGCSLQARVRAPLTETRAYGPVPTLATAATHDPETGHVSLFALNRSLDQVLPLSVDLRGFGPMRVEGHAVLADADLDAVNTEEAPGRVAPQQGQGAVVRDGALQMTLAPASWHCLTLVSGK